MMELAITDGYTGARLRVQLAQAAYCLAKDKEQIEKSISVGNDIFEQCLLGMPEHHKEFNRRRGFLRTYHKPFWTENEGNLGKTYHHGIIHIINKDSEINSTYSLNSYDHDLATELNHRVGMLRHRIIYMTEDNEGYTYIELTPQRVNLDND